MVLPINSGLPGGASGNSTVHRKRGQFGVARGTDGQCLPLSPRLVLLPTAAAHQTATTPRFAVAFEGCRHVVLGGVVVEGNLLRSLDRPESYEVEIVERSVGFTAVIQKPPPIAVKRLGGPDFCGNVEVLIWTDLDRILRGVIDDLPVQAQDVIARPEILGRKQLSMPVDDVYLDVLGRRGDRTIRRLIHGGTTFVEVIEKGVSRQLQYGGPLRPPVSINFDEHPSNHLIEGKKKDDGQASWIFITE